MEAFKRGIAISSWGELFTGLKKNWITAKEVLVYCQNGSISCNEEQFIQLYLALDDSMFDFMGVVTEYVKLENKSSLILNDNGESEDLIFTSMKNLKFWEIEFLLRILNSSFDKKEKLHQVAAIHSDFNYPVSWHSFLYYMPTPNLIPIGIDGLYNNFVNYLENQIHLYSNSIGYGNL